MEMWSWKTKDIFKIVHHYTHEIRNEHTLCKTILTAFVNEENLHIAPQKED